MDLKEAARKLGISETTARRWVKTGRLQARVIEGPYGPQYDIDPEALEAARNFDKMPVVVRGGGGVVSQEALMQLVQQAVNKALASELNRVAHGVYAELQALRNELAETRRQLEAERAKDRAWQEERDRQLMQAIREIQRRQEKENKPFWRRLFKRLL